MSHEEAEEQPWARDGRGQVEQCLVSSLQGQRAGPGKFWEWPLNTPAC